MDGKKLIVISKLKMKKLGRNLIY